MTEVTVHPTRATVIVPLPEGFSCGYSPGLLLHAEGTGASEVAARAALADNLKQLAAHLLDLAEGAQA